MNKDTQERFADLHIHTFYSDSTSSPKEIVEEAIQGGLHCIAITDHDTVEGIKPALEAAKDFDLEVIPGVELSSEMNGKDVHVLGYMINYEDQNLIECLKTMQASRIERMEKMIKKLESLGIRGIDLDEVCALVKSDAVGRPHLAMTLLEKGKVSSIKAAFDQYLADGAPAYVPKFKQTTIEAVDLIKKAGGLAVLAHPMVTNVDEMIPELAREGLDGIEVYYPNNTNAVTKFYEGIAKKHDLVMTGGSDAHGKTKKHTYVGKVKIPYEIIAAMKKKNTVQ